MLRPLGPSKHGGGAVGLKFSFLLEGALFYVAGSDLCTGFMLVGYLSRDCRSTGPSLLFGQTVLCWVLFWHPRHRRNRKSSKNPFGKEMDICFLSGDSA